MRFSSRRLPTNRGSADSNRWITRPPSDADATAGSSRHVDALRELYERPSLHRAEQEQK
jgi:hypothetical protein